MYTFHSTAQKRCSICAALSSFCVDVNVFFYVCTKTPYTNTHIHACAHTSFSSLNEIYRVCFAHALCALCCCFCLFHSVPFLRSALFLHLFYFVFFFISLIARSFIRSNFYSFYYLVCALALACSQSVSQPISQYMYNMMVFGNMFRPTIVRDVTSHSSSSCYVVVVAVVGRCLCTRSFNTANRISSTDFFLFWLQKYSNKDPSQKIIVEVL